MNASILTTLGGFPTVVVAIFHAQSGWSIDFGVRLPVGSDVMAMLNLGSKKPCTAAILMQLVFLLHTHGCSLAANHVPREFNQWADELTHPDFSGFDPLQRVPKQELCEEFVFLLNGDAFDLSVDPPMLP